MFNQFIKASIIVIGALLSAILLSVLLASVIPAQDAINRLYAAIYLGLIFGITVLIWSILPKNFWVQLSRSWGWNIVTIPLLIVWG